MEPEAGAEDSLGRIGGWGGRESGANMGAWGGQDSGAEGSLGRKGGWGGPTDWRGFQLGLRPQIVGKIGRR